MSEPSDYPHVVDRLPPEEGGYYVLRYPDVPGCLGVGDSEAEAIEDGRRALTACLDALKAVDRSPPIPASRTVA
jgi:antitoxin HicB